MAMVLVMYSVCLCIRYRCYGVTVMYGTHYVVVVGRTPICDKLDVVVMVCVAMCGTMSLMIVCLCVVLHPSNI